MGTNKKNKKKKGPSEKNDGFASIVVGGQSSFPKNFQSFTEMKKKGVWFKKDFT